jgi:hypothetical protein
MPTPPILTAAQVTAAIAAALGPEYSPRLWARGGFLRIYLRRAEASHFVDLGYFTMTRGVLAFVGDDRSYMEKVLAHFRAASADTIQP